MWEICFFDKLLLKSRQTVSICWSCCRLWDFLLKSLKSRHKWPSYYHISLQLLGGCAPQTPCLSLSISRTTFKYLATALSADLLSLHLVTFLMFFILVRIFSLSSAPAHRFFPGLKLHEAIRTAHWRTMASFTTPFFLHVYACAQIT